MIKLVRISVSPHHSVKCKPCLKLFLPLLPQHLPLLSSINTNIRMIKSAKACILPNSKILPITPLTATSKLSLHNLQANQPCSLQQVLAQIFTE